jgi:hypothetical protein
MRILRSLVLLAFVAGFAMFGMTVPIGKHTLFGHLNRVWNTAEAQEMVKSIREESGPAIERIKRGLSAGLEEASKPNQISAAKASLVSVAR